MRCIVMDGTLNLIMGHHLASRRSSRSYVPSQAYPRQEKGKEERKTPSLVGRERAVKAAARSCLAHHEGRHHPQLRGAVLGARHLPKVSVNGVDQGLLYGVRAPSSNNPIENVNDAEFACNKGIQHKDNNVITVPAGAKVGARYQHVIGGPQGAFDADNPIASSHKGPIMVYLAKVSNAATTGTTGLKWFKIAEEGITGTTWALLALHSATGVGGAQFYMECAQIRVTGSGTNDGSGSTVSFPGAYSSSDPGILTSGGGNTGGAALYAQCGGMGWSGPTTCAQGKCTKSNDWYSQCLP
ncbi:unnamed protein product [Parascedosporium putredinis]|uniref:lytic cellulose monooxygenase (C4-dehydrogenating) n=1 Tax=Parascedosporium putredinis TaxID=1442378 RepID=A0A9P1GYR3_9PEZI|nr:unnamed protein product [Parascedosporium putredinis]CAI7990224.1 unnamed protein product [Parascedosporium putredinis]